MSTVKLDLTDDGARQSTKVEPVPEISSFYKLVVIYIKEHEEIMVCPCCRLSSLVCEEIGYLLFAIRSRDVQKVAAGLDVLLNLVLSHLVVVIEVRPKHRVHVMNCLGEHIEHECFWEVISLVVKDLSQDAIKVHIGALVGLFGVRLNKVALSIERVPGAICEVFMFRAICLDRRIIAIFVVLHCSDTIVILIRVPVSLSVPASLCSVCV